MAPWKKQSGFSLLEVLLAVSIAIALGSLQLSQIRRDTESTQAKAVGENLKLHGNALNSYITLQYGNITNMTSQAAPGTVEDPGPRTCDTGTRTCTVTATTLQGMGLLPSSSSGRNPYGSTYEYHIRVTGSAPNWQVEGMVITAQPYTIGNEPRFDLIGQAMLTAGADSGTTRTAANRIDGFNGSWSDTNFPSTVLGQLAYRSGYGTNNYAAFMRLDGTTPMQNDMDLGGHDIRNVDNVIAQEDVHGRRLVTNAPATDAIIIGNGALQADGSLPTGTNPDRVIMGNSGNALRIRSNGGIILEDVLTNTPTGLNAGTGQFAGNVTTSADMVAAGTIQGGSLVSGSTISAAGTITTTGDIHADGNIDTDGNLIVDQTINSNALVVGNGGISITGTGTLNVASGVLGLGPSGLSYDAVNDRLNVGGTGSLYAGGQLMASTMRSQGLLTADQFVQINGVQAPGGSCTTGQFSRDAGGRLLQCLGSGWAFAGITTGVTINGGAVGANGTSTATCPAGTRITGGGYTLVYRGTVNDPYSPASSYADPVGNRWIVLAGAGHGSQFQASALCVS